MERPDGRTPDQLREIRFLPHVAPHATGSVLVAFGGTRVICSAMIEEGVPRWMKEQGVSGGWLTAEYAMLPYSTLTRKARDSTRGRADGRSVEIQRLIGRSLRAVVDLKLLGQRTLWIDCDVLQADGGTRTASITGACVACALAFDRLLEAAVLTRNPLMRFVAAVSAGVLEETAIVDLCYIEDRDAKVDFNFVMTEDLEFVEMQGSGEEATFTEAEMGRMLEMSKVAIGRLTAMQRDALTAARSNCPDASAASLEELAAQFGRR